MKIEYCKLSEASKDVLIGMIERLEQENKFLKELYRGTEDYKKLVKEINNEIK